MDMFIISVLKGNTHPSFTGIIPIKYLQTAPMIRLRNVDYLFFSRA